MQDHENSNEVQNQAAAADVAFGHSAGPLHRQNGQTQCGEGATAVGTPDRTEGTDGGTPPSNTVPPNSTPQGFKALRFGIDSLYLSYSGLMSDEWDSRLTELKEQAQSEDERIRALAQIKIGSHLFEVSGKGMRRFHYVLRDNCYTIQLSRGITQSNMPLAYVQISSDYLNAAGPEAAEADLTTVIQTFGLAMGTPNVSRADIYLDFTCDEDLSNVEPRHWVTRANLMAKYYDCKQEEPFTGWSIGMGGELGARLYNKMVEILTQSPHKAYLFNLWQEAGWEVGKPVWRMEFQLNREVLKEFETNKLPKLMQQLPLAWQYLTADWLRLTTPKPSDKTRSRWPNTPLWDAITGAPLLHTDQPRLQRFRPERVPDDAHLFVHGLGGLTSFMAREGITDMYKGLAEYMIQAERYHYVKGEHIKSYVQRKVKDKGRKYNTINNREHDLRSRVATKRRADAYRKMRDGDDEAS